MRDKRWEAFCAYSIEDCERYFLEAIDESGFTANPKQTSINNMQNFMLGTEGKVKGIIIKGKNPIELKIISVSRDPFYRVFMSLFGSHKIESISLLSMHPLNSVTQHTMYKVMQCFFKKAPSPPWDIEHPRFKLSLILNYRNKRKWDYWRVQQNLKLG